MQFTIAALSVLLPLLVQGSPVSDLAARAGRPTSFEVRTSGSCSGAGTVISPSGSTAKGNFSPSQNSIEVLTAAGNCHVTMYSGSNQSGSTSRLNTDTAGVCIITSGSWLSYGYYCD